MSRDVRYRSTDRTSDRSRTGTATALARATCPVVVVVVAAGVVMSGCGGGKGGTGGGAGSTARATTSASAQSGSVPGLSPATRRELRQLDRRLKVVRTPPQQVRGVVTVVLELGGAATCDPPLVTARYVKVAYGSRQGCVNATRSHAGIADKLRFRECSHHRFHGHGCGDSLRRALRRREDHRLPGPRSALVRRPAPVERPRWPLARAGRHPGAARVPGAPGRWAAGRGPGPRQPRAACPSTQAFGAFRSVCGKKAPTPNGAGASRPAARPRG